jgi:carbamate kinase
LLKQLFSAGVLVIACGGGGIPVVLRGEDGAFEGVEAVIDKDQTAAILATNIGAEVLLILTDVDRVFLNYGKPDQKEIARMTLEEAKRHLAEGHFAPSSMRPKIESAIKFVECGGEKTIITSIEQAKAALEGKAGTVVA